MSKKTVTSLRIEGWINLTQNIKIKKHKPNIMRSCCDRFKNEEHHPDCGYRV